MKPVLFMLATLLPCAALADEAVIRKAFADRYANVSVTSITATAIPGIYEVFAGGQILYADEKGDHLLMGPLVETRSRTNLTQQRIEALKAVKFDSLPFDQAITVVKGKGERRIAVFSDPDCPFCRKLEQELAGMDNLTIHVFLLPLKELHPQAVEIAGNVWCADDRAGAWNAYMLEGKKPEAGKNCATPIDAVAALAGELGINGTPAIILSNGRRLEGAVPAAKLEALLGGS
ncbi:MAG: DsbC family protein [Pseudomonadota bacterium]